MIRLRSGIGLAGAILAIVAVAACTQAPPPSREDVLISLTDELLVPRFQSVAEEMDGLRAALDALCANPSPDTLGAARTAWREARAPWMRSQAMWFGPVMDRRSRTLVDWSPVDPERIEKLLAEKDSITATDVREFLASTQRGLGAIEYVLFGEDERVLRQLAQSDGIRCHYLSALGDVVAEEMAGVSSDWTGGGAVTGGYAAYLNGTGRISLVDQEAVDEVVRTSVFLTRSVSDMKLGKALGASGGQPDPSAIPGGSGHNAVADLRNQVLGMRDVYLGADGDSGLGVSELVSGVSKDADDRMRDHFATALAAIDELEEPLPSTMLDDPAPVRVAHQRMQELQRALNTEVVSLLGVTVGFADTDGDGG